jgi:nucleoside-diphosphate-sugar epimerase
MKVLIAGGTGFLGRHLINSLIADSPEEMSTKLRRWRD